MAAPSAPAAPPLSKGASLLRVTVLYAVALVVAAGWLLLGPDTPWVLLDTLVADVLATLVVFAGSRLLGNSSCYDAYWSVAPPLIAAYWWFTAPGDVDGVRFALLAVVLGLWAVRLTGNWVRSWPGLHHEDWRYPLLRDKAPSPAAEVGVDLMAIHVVPTLQVFAAMLPVYAVTRSDRGWGWLDLVALAVGLGAVALEHVSDQQLFRFAANRRPGDVLDTGVWGWSRHPNYFGELMLWVSMALFGLSASPADFWWVLPGAAGIAAMLLGASIPMMEERSLARRPEYADVVARVPRLVPRPPRRTGSGG